MFITIIRYIMLLNYMLNLPIGKQVIYWGIIYWCLMAMSSISIFIHRKQGCGYSTKKTMLGQAPPIVASLPLITERFINLLGPSDAIWCWRFCSTLIQAMACRLTAPSHYLLVSQHWFRQWLVAWRHQAITWTNVDLSWVRSCGIRLRTSS